MPTIQSRATAVALTGVALAVAWIARLISLARHHATPVSITFAVIMFAVAVGTTVLSAKTRSRAKRGGF